MRGEHLRDTPRPYRYQSRPARSGDVVNIEAMRPKVLTRSECLLVVENRDQLNNLELPHPTGSRDLDLVANFLADERPANG